MNIKTTATYVVDGSALSCTCPKGQTKQACRHLLFLLHRHQDILKDATHQQHQLHADIARGRHRVNRELYHVPPALEAEHMEKQAAAACAASAPPVRSSPAGPAGAAGATAATSAGPEIWDDWDCGGDDEGGAWAWDDSLPHSPAVVDDGITPLKCGGMHIKRVDLPGPPSAGEFKNMKRLAAAADKDAFLRKCAASVIVPCGIEA